MRGGESRGKKGRVGKTREEEKEEEINEEKQKKQKKKKQSQKKKKKTITNILGIIRGNSPYIKQEQDTIEKKTTREQKSFLGK